MHKIPHKNYWGLVKSRKRDFIMNRRNIVVYAEATAWDQEQIIQYAKLFRNVIAKEVNSYGGEVYVSFINKEVQGTVFGEKVLKKIQGAVGPRIQWGHVENINEKVMGNTDVSVFIWNPDTGEFMNNFAESIKYNLLSVIIDPTRLISDSLLPI